MADAVEDATQFATVSSGLPVARAADRGQPLCPVHGALRLAGSGALRAPHGDEIGYSVLEASDLRALARCDPAPERPHVEGARPLARLVWAVARIVTGSPVRGGLQHLEGDTRDERQYRR